MVVELSMVDLLGALDDLALHLDPLGLVGEVQEHLESVFPLLQREVVFNGRVEAGGDERWITREGLLPILDALKRLKDGEVNVTVGIIVILLLLALLDWLLHAIGQELRWSLNLVDL